MEKDPLFSTFTTIESSLKQAEQKVDLYANPERQSIWYCGACYYRHHV